jgi:hypothetical protein
VAVISGNVSRGWFGVAWRSVALRGAVVKEVSKQGIR